MAVELVIERAEDFDGIILTKIGDWAFEGPLQGISLHKSSDGTRSEDTKLPRSDTVSRANSSSAHRWTETLAEAASCTFETHL